MSSSSSEAKTQTSTCGDAGGDLGGAGGGDSASGGNGEESTILYAFPEDPPPYQQYFQPNIPRYGEALRPFVELIGHFQVIYDAIRQIDRKCDVIDRKVSKIRRAQAKQCEHCTDEHKGQDTDFERTEDEEMEAMERLNSFSHSESYSPTSPVRRPEISADENIIAPFNYGDSQEMEQEIEEPLYKQEPFDGGSPIPTNCTGGAHCTCMRCASMPVSPTFPGNPSMLSAEVSMMSHSVPLTPKDSCLKHSLDVNSLSGFPESKRIRKSFQNSTGFVTSSPIISNTDILKRTLPEDPVHWSVEDVILFLNHADFQMSGPITYLLRKHEIDGKALLLLNNDMIINYMGLKLGPSLKLCHYIEKLKERKSLSAFRNLD